MQRLFEISKLAPFQLLDEPLLAFNPNNASVDANPLRGLERFGPYSSTTFGEFNPSIRLASIAPASSRENLRRIINTLRTSHAPGDRKEYVPGFGGFEKIFRIPLEAAKTAEAHIKLNDDLKQLGSNGSPDAMLLSALSRAFERLALQRDQFDIAIVYLPDSWEVAFKTPSFDAHDAVKALGALHNIPTQVINDRASKFPYKASIAWRLSIALYVKAGGIPWKLCPLPQSPDDTAYIGLAYALRGNPEDAHYVTCCSQVFDADGGGMQFVAFEARDPVDDITEARHNPFLSRSDMRAVIARSLRLYQDRTGGRLPRRLVIHKTTAFKTDELNGALDALVSVPEVECIEVGQRSGWRGVWLKESSKLDIRSEPDKFPVPRGTTLQRTENSILLWVAGNAPKASYRGDYYQGKKSIPKPINLVRHAGSGPLSIIAEEALALTKMDWNNDALYDPVPVTIRYSQRLARTIANVPDLPRRAYPYRLFM